MELHDEGNKNRHRVHALAPNLASVRALCREVKPALLFALKEHPTYDLVLQVSKLGCVLGLAWTLEYHPPFQHSAKVWNRDLYYFLCLLLLLYALQVDQLCASITSTEYIAPIHPLTCCPGCSNRQARSAEPRANGRMERMDAVYVPSLPLLSSRRNV